MKAIKKEGDYRKVMSEILALMNKGDDNLSKIQKQKLRDMASAAQAYEKSIYSISPPKTIEGMIELKNV